MMTTALPIALLTLALAAPPTGVPAAGQSVPAPAGASGAPGGGAPALPENVGEAQAPVVAGNLAGARERALDDALRHVLETAINRVVDEATRTAQARKIKGLLSRPRRYVRSYRTIDEGEEGGAYRVRVEAEIDEVALRRELEKAIPVAGSSGAQQTGPGLALVGTGAADGVEAAAQAASASGLKLVRAPAGQEPRAAEWAARSGIPTLHVAAAATEEGLVRGPALVSVACKLVLRLVGAHGGEIASETVTRRAFAERADTARVQCLSRASSDGVAQLVRNAGGELQGGSDLRTLVIDAQLTEAPAVPALMKVLRSIGSVSSVELRKIQSGHAEIWVRSRLTPAAVVAAATRDGAKTLVMEPVESGGDLVRLRVSLPPAPEPTAPTQSQPPAPVQ